MKTGLVCRYHLGCVSLELGWYADIVEWGFSPGVGVGCRSWGKASKA